VISVVIPVRDGGERIRHCLEAIRAQRTVDEVEIVVVDSGSVDGTQSLARSLGARVHEIPPGRFNHGGARNLGAQLARGDIVVFTVDDASPVGPDWLARLTAPLRRDGAVAGAYSRQIPYEDTPPYQRFYIDTRFGPTARVQRARDPSELSVDNVLFSNVASAIRRPVLESHPFATDIVIAEDLEWCARVLLAGHAVVYVPEAVVRHSHRYTLADAFRRYFDQGAAARRIYMARGRSSPRAVRGEGLAFVRRELGWLWQTGERLSIPAALAHEAARFLGFQVGAHYRAVPSPLRPRLSRTPVYWTQSGDEGGSTD
jgi:rhamnosyltransferase